MSTSSNTSTNSVHNRSKQCPAIASHQGITRQATEAAIAEDRYLEASHNTDVETILGVYESNHARNNVINKKLIVLFMEKFNMNARQAQAAVEREMKEKYPSNPWDECPRRQTTRPQRTEKRHEERAVSTQVKTSTDYGKEQWDLFERTFQ